MYTISFQIWVPTVTMILVIKLNAEYNIGWVNAHCFMLLSRIPITWIITSMSIRNYNKITRPSVLLLCSMEKVLTICLFLAFPTFSALLSF